MKALISPDEQVIVNSAACYRVCDIAQAAFPVASPFFWMDCDPSVIADEFYFDPTSNLIVAFPPKTGASTPAYQSAYTQAQVGALLQPNVSGLVMW